MPGDFAQERLDQSIIACRWHLEHRDYLDRHIFLRPPWASLTSSDPHAIIARARGAPDQSTEAIKPPSNVITLPLTWIHPRIEICDTI
jgi:hypothetical protein